uniref:Gp47 n=1 Tax=uncultured marine virus TaxID=186617 RepID=A0A0F7L895_9VIRU|nr:gp47 [uncultured marine virus]
MPVGLPPRPQRQAPRKHPYTYRAMQDKPCRMGRARHTPLLLLYQPHHYRT